MGLVCLMVMTQCKAIFFLHEEGLVGLVVEVFALKALKWARFTTYIDGGTEKVVVIAKTKLAH